MAKFNFGLLEMVESQISCLEDTTIQLDYLFKQKLSLEFVNSPDVNLPNFKHDFGKMELVVKMTIKEAVAKLE
jgi:hypothetical protein